MRNHELVGKRLSARGHEVHIFGVKWWEGEDTIEYENMNLHGACKAQALYVNGRHSISEAFVFGSCPQIIDLILYIFEYIIIGSWSCPQIIEQEP